MRRTPVLRRRVVGPLTILACLSLMSGLALALVIRSDCPRNSCRSLVGDPSVERGLDSNPPRLAEAFRVVAGKTGVARSIHLYVDARSGARTVLIGVYRTSHNRPSVRLAATRLSSPSPGAWNVIGIRALRVRARHVYWLAILGTGGRISFRDRPRGPCISVTSAQHDLAALPRRWRSGTRYATCPVSAFLSSKRAPRRTTHRSAPAPEPSGPPAPACTTTVGPGANVNAILQNAPGGTVLCLASGSYDNGGEFDLNNITPATPVTLENAPGATADMGWMNIKTMSNVVIRGLDLNGGVSVTNAASGDVFEYNRISGSLGAGTGFYFYGNGEHQSGIQVLANQIDHLAPSDLSPPGAGQCITVNGGAATEQNFTFSGNICGPGIANHYTQFGGIDGLTEDYNQFLGPAAAEAISQNEHNNVLQIFGGGDNIDFSHNVIRDGDSRGQTVLLQMGHFTNVTVNYNLWVEDPTCLNISANCGGYAFGMCAASNLQFNYNTVVDSLYGIQVTNSVVTDSGGNPTGCTNKGSGYTVTHNIVVGTGDNADITYNECRSACTFDYNVTDDTSARQGGSAHYVINWTPRWTDGSSYRPAGLPFAAGYGG